MWTAERKKRHGLQDSDAYTLCDQCAETVGHLVTACVYSRQLWVMLLDPIGLLELVLVMGDDRDMADWWMKQRRVVHQAHRSAFGSIVILVT